MKLYYFLKGFNLNEKIENGILPSKQRLISKTEIKPLNNRKEVEYFFASDASAVIEHTNRVIFLEDDDIASICDGCKLTD